MKTEYITKENALAENGMLKINLGGGVPFYIHDVILAADIKALPAEDVAPVVRCRDCANLDFKDFHGICERGPVCGPISPDDFCSFGRRKAK